MDEDTITITINERVIRALLSSVTFTLEKYTGQEDLDQETLLSLKPSLQACVFEFTYHKPDKY